MNAKNGLAVAGLAMILAAGSALADEHGVLEATIRLMGVVEADLPNAVTKEIKLPDGVSEDNSSHPSAYGIETANTARERRTEGLGIAISALDDAAEMADTAQDNAENHSRGDTPPELPTRGSPGG